MSMGVWRLRQSPPKSALHTGRASPMPLLLWGPTRYSACSLKFQNFGSDTRSTAPGTLLVIPSFTVHSIFRSVRSRMPPAQITAVEQFYWLARL